MTSYGTGINFCPNLIPCIHSKDDSDAQSLTLVEEFLQTTSPREKALIISEQISKRYSDINDENIKVRYLIRLVKDL